MRVRATLTVQINEKTDKCFMLPPRFEPRHCGDADDPRRADGDAGFHHGLIFDVQQTHLEGERIEEEGHGIQSDGVTGGAQEEACKRF